MDLIKFENLIKKLLCLLASCEGIIVWNSSALLVYEDVCNFLGCNVMRQDHFEGLKCWRLNKFEFRIFAFQIVKYRWHLDRQRLFVISLHHTAHNFWDHGSVCFHTFARFFSKYEQEILCNLLCAIIKILSCNKFLLELFLDFPFEILS